MRRMLLITSAVFILSMAVCTFSTIGIERVVERCQELRNAAVMAMDSGAVQETEEGLSALATYLEEHQGWLEILLEHEELHEIKNQILEAKLGLEYGIEDDFYQAIAKVEEALEHVRSIESVSLSNLY